MFGRSLVLLLGLALLFGALVVGCSDSDDDLGVTDSSTSVSTSAQSHTSTPPASVPTTSETPLVTSTSSEENALKQWDSPPEMIIDPARSYRAIIHTNMGDLTVALHAEDAPITVNNFVFLSREGFYDGVIFHRVMKGFMIQTGDPTGTGFWGPGYNLPDEPVVGEYEFGTLAMANKGIPNSGGSQFFICEADLSQRLPKNYTIFGHVMDNDDLVHEIASVPVTVQNGELSKPTVDVHIESIEIVEGD